MVRVPSGSQALPVESTWRLCLHSRCESSLEAEPPIEQSQALPGEDVSPGQKRLPWDDWKAPIDEIHNIAKKFVLANCLNPEIASIQFDAAT